MMRSAHFESPNQQIESIRRLLLDRFALSQVPMSRNRPAQQDQLANTRVLHLTQPVRILLCLALIKLGAVQSGLFSGTDLSETEYSGVVREILMNEQLYGRKFNGLRFPKGKVNFWGLIYADENQCVRQRIDLTIL